MPFAESEEEAIPPGFWPNVSLPEGARIHRDLLYAETPEKPLWLDLYLPAESDGPLPLVVWIHGGGWQEGNRIDGCPFHLVGNGFALASISYRFSREALFPAQIHDCKAAVRWLRAHAAQYGLDAGRIGAWGASAGGHLASLLGLTAGCADLEGDVGGNREFPSDVQAVCNYCGPSDLLLINQPGRRENLAWTLTFVEALVGGPLEERPDAARAASPISYVRGGEPPFLIVNGDSDPLIPPEQAEILHRALEQAGSQSEIFLVPGGGHIFWGDELDRRVLAFFRQHLRCE